MKSESTFVLVLFGISALCLFMSVLPGAVDGFSIGDLGKGIFVFLFTFLICGAIILVLTAGFFVVLAWATRVIARGTSAVRRNLRIIAGREPENEGRVPPEDSV